MVTGVTNKPVEQKKKPDNQNNANNNQGNVNEPTPEAQSKIQVGSDGQITEESERNIIKEISGRKGIDSSAMGTKNDWKKLAQDPNSGVTLEKGPNGEEVLVIEDEVYGTVKIAMGGGW